MKKGKMRVASLLIGVLMLAEMVCEPCLSVSAQEVGQTSYDEIKAEQETVTEIKKNEKKIYSFQPEKTAEYVISSKGGKDTCVHIYDENMNEISHDNDSGEEFNFNVTVAMDETSTYYIEVGLFQLDDEGEVVWKVEEKQQPQETQLQQIAVDSQSNLVASSSGDFKTKVLSNGTVAITDYMGKAKNLKIPSSIDGRKVTVIGEKAFECGTIWEYKNGQSVSREKKNNIQTVVIPKTVVEIQYASFAGCTKLKTVQFAKGSKLKTIGEEAFANARALSKIQLPTSVKKIGSKSFIDCTKLTDCGLNKMKSLEAIEYEAFENSGIKQIYIPNSVKSIGWGAFYGCKSAKKIYIGKKLSSTGSYAFAGSGITSVKIPSNIKTIEYGAFSNTNLTAIKIPDTVTTVESKAFAGCENLKTATLSKNITSISAGAFSGTGLQKINIGKKTKVIEDEAFARSIALKSIEIPDSVVDIQYGAFKDCTSLAKIKMPKSLERLGGKNFDNTKWYKNQPKGMVYAGKVFYTYKGKLPKNKSISIKPGTKGIAGFAMTDSSVKSVSIPQGVTNIGEVAFFNCKNLKSIYIPKSVKEIGIGAVGMVPAGEGTGNTIYLDGHIWRSVQRQKGFTIMGVKGSAAETYAKQYGITFKPCYKVVFKVGKKVLSTQYVEKGKSAKAPASKNKGYSINWNKKFDNVKSNMTVTGKWNNYLTITLDNGGANTSGTKRIFEKYKKSFSSTAAFKIKINKIAVPKKDGYIFGGYYTKRNGKGTKCIDKKGKICIKTNVISKDTTLYAKWTATKYNVVLHTNDGTENTQTIACVYNQKANLLPVSRQGYRLEAWTTGADGSGVAYAPNAEIVNLTKDGTTIHLYAKWKKLSGEEMARLALAEATGQTYAGSVYITEVGGVYNKYNNYNGKAWCAYFVNWCANQIGVSSSVIPQDPYVPTLYTTLINNCGAQVVSKPKAGDLVFYRSNGKYIHVGLMVNETQSIQGNVYVKTNDAYRSYLVKMDNPNLYLDENGYQCQTVFVRPNY